MKKITLLLFGFCLSIAATAQDYQTPNTGMNYSLDDLIAEAPETFSVDNDTYFIHQDFTLSENDTLTLESVSVKIAGEVRITVEGTFLSYGTEDQNTFIDAVDETPYDGFRFEEIAEVYIDQTTIKNGGGLKAITPNFTITHSTLENNVSGVASGAVIALSHGSVLIENNRFVGNEVPAVSSPANGDVAAQILNNYIEANSTSNLNRPQLNMGPTGANTLKIIGNTIVGDRDLNMVGGISVAALIGDDLNAVIEGNTIIDNRYGINIQGSGSARIQVTDNIIEDNDTDGKPNTGGSGVSINSGNEDFQVDLSGNEFRNNLWGVTIIGTPTVNLGDDEDNPGNNIFSENGNNGVVYALYNNGPNTVMAKHNCWIEGQESTLEEAAEVIFDQADDPNLGEVIYDPINCGVLGLPILEKNTISMYPNPAENLMNFKSAVEIQSIVIFDINGKKIQTIHPNSLQGTIDLNLESGFYLVEFSAENGSTTKKLMVK